MTKHIEMTVLDVSSINYALYCAGRKEHEFEKVEIDKVLLMNLIEPVQSEWTSPIEFAPKNHSSLQCSMDYLNMIIVTVNDAYPVLKMNECLDSLEKATILFTFDASYGYLQIEMGDQSKDETKYI